MYGAKQKAFVQEKLTCRCDSGMSHLFPTNSIAMPAFFFAASLSRCSGLLKYRRSSCPVSKREGNQRVHVTLRVGIGCSLRVVRLFVVYTQCRQRRVMSMLRALVVKAAVICCDASYAATCVHTPKI